MYTWSSFVVHQAFTKGTSFQGISARENPKSTNLKTQRANVPSKSDCAMDVWSRSGRVWRPRLKIEEVGRRPVSSLIIQASSVLGATRCHVFTTQRPDLSARDIGDTVAAASTDATLYPGLSIYPDLAP